LRAEIVKQKTVPAEPRSLNPSNSLGQSIWPCLLVSGSIRLSLEHPKKVEAAPEIRDHVGSFANPLF
jgi:hypothetical protein